LLNLYKKHVRILKFEKIKMLLCCSISYCFYNSSVLSVSMIDNKEQPK